MTIADFNQPIIKSEINAEKFGFSVNGENNAEALQKAIDHCKSSETDRLFINPGIYPITLAKPLRLYGMENFEIFAEGVRFVVFSPITPKQSILYFEIKGCNRIKFTGLEIDWNWKKARLASLLKVVELADDYVDFEFMEEGDLLEFRNGDLSPTGFTAKIARKETTEDGLNIVLDQKIPDYIKENSVIFNRAFCSDHYEIRNCYFHETRARGILAQANHGIIENCKFYRIQGAAIQIETGASPTWSEGMGVDDLIIRNNEIIECDINDWDKAVLYMSTFLPEGIPIKNTEFPNPTTTVGDSGADFRTAYPMFTNIVIENNLFKEYPRRAMILTSYDGITLRNNVFKNEIPRKYNNPERGSIWSAYGKNLHLENNTFEPAPYMLMPEIIEE